MNQIFKPQNISFQQKTKLTHLMAEKKYTKKYLKNVKIIFWNKILQKGFKIIEKISLLKEKFWKLWKNISKHIKIVNET